jgi:hypothetical protein
MRASRLFSLCSACAAVAVLAAAATGDAATRPTETNGQAQAVLARIVPYVGLPGVAAGIGMTAAQVEGGSARSSATAADFGLLGTLAGAAAEGMPALPVPITADSEGRTQVDRDPVPLDGSDGSKTPDPAAAAFQAAHEQAVATKAPVSARGTVTGPSLGIPGLIEITGGRSRSTADAKQAVSDVTIGSLNLGAGAVVLTGLHWTATQIDKTVGTATFSLGGMTVAGQAMPLSGADSLATALTAANTALEPVGLALAGPTSTADTNGGAVAPMIIQVRNPEALVAPSAQASEAVKPVLGQLMAAVLAAYPQASASQIVLNAALGAAGGRSGGRLELGGVSARLAQLAVADEELLAPATGLDTMGTSGSPGADGAAGAPGKSAVYPGPAGAAAPAVGSIPAVDSPVPGDAALPAGAPAAVDQAQNLAAAAPTALTGVDPRNVAFGVHDSPTRRTASVALGLGLLAVLGLAIGDRLRIRALSRP